MALQVNPLLATPPSHVGVPVQVLAAPIPKQHLQEIGKEADEDLSTWVQDTHVGNFRGSWRTIGQKMCILLSLCLPLFAIQLNT